MKIQEIAFSCYPVTNIEKSRTFYEGVLGLEVTMNNEREGTHFIEYDIGEGTLTIGKAPGMKPSSEGCSVSLEVDNFDNAIAELKDAEIKFALEPIDTGGCQMAFVFDPDGNTVGIHKRRQKV